MSPRGKRQLDVVPCGSQVDAPEHRRAATGHHRSGQEQRSRTGPQLVGDRHICMDVDALEQALPRRTIELAPGEQAQLYRVRAEKCLAGQLLWNMSGRHPTTLADPQGSGGRCPQAMVVR